jgi:hypothetical protein
MKYITIGVSLALICSLALPVPAHAQGRVIVMTRAQNLAADSGRGGVPNAASDDAVAEIVTAALLRQGYRVVERSVLNAVLREQGFHRSGIVDQSTAVRIGRLAGAQAILLVNVHGHTTTQHRGQTGDLINSFLGGMGGSSRFNLGQAVDPSGTVHEVSMTAKLIDVESAEVVWAGDESARSQPGRSASQTELIREIVARLDFPSPPEGRSRRRESRPAYSDDEGEIDRPRRERRPRTDRPASERRATVEKPSVDHSLRAVQGRLKELGYYTGKVDGRDNSATREALSRFQHDRKLLTTGTADPATKQRLGVE